MLNLTRSLNDPWIVLIELRGTEFNRRINLLPGLGFSRGLALIGFRTTGVRIFVDLAELQGIMFLVFTCSRKPKELIT